MSTTPIGDPPSLSTVQGEWGVGALAGLSGLAWYNPSPGNFGGLPINLRAAIGKYSTNPSYQINHNWVTEISSSYPVIYSLDQPQSGSGQLYVCYGLSFVDVNKYIHIMSASLPSPYVPKQIYNAGSGGWTTASYVGQQDFSAYGIGTLYTWYGPGTVPQPENPNYVIWGV